MQAGINTHNEKQNIHAHQTKPWIKIYLFHKTVPGSARTLTIPMAVLFAYSFLLLGSSRLPHLQVNAKLSLYVVTKQNEALSKGLRSDPHTI